MTEKFQAWLVANGYDAEAVAGADHDRQRKHLEAAWKAETEPPPVATPVPPPAAQGGTQTMDEIIAAARTEEARKNRITEMVGEAVTSPFVTAQGISTFEALGRQAIEGKWDLQKFELEMLRAGRPSGPGVHVARHNPEVNDSVIEAAVCKGAGLTRMEKYFPGQVLEATDRHYKHGMGLCDLIMTYARKGGYGGHSVKANPEAAMKAARRATDIQAAGSWGPSTQGASIGSMLANVANKFLRNGFEAVENVWSRISARRSVNDFKQVSTYSLTGDLTFKKLPPGGEIQHGQIDATSYTNQVDTYARMLGLDRRDVLNDDISAFASVSRRLGRGGAIALNKLFWGIFLNNSSFFTSGRNNVTTGIGSPYLTLAALDISNAKFRTQTDVDGNPVGVMPRILLVPPALEATAKTLMSSALLASGATTAPGTPTANIWANMFTVESSAYMQDSSLTGYSASTWYLLASPEDMPVIEVAFLNGQETPIVETADSDFGMLGQAFRGYFDLGVALQEYRGGQKNTA